MPSYASSTTVSPEKSQADIRDTLRRYGADGFAAAEAGQMPTPQLLALPLHNKGGAS